MKLTAAVPEQDASPLHARWDETIQPHRRAFTVAAATHRRNHITQQRQPTVGLQLPPFRTTSANLTTACCLVLDCNVHSKKAAHSWVAREVVRTGEIEDRLRTPMGGRM